MPLVRCWELLWGLGYKSGQLKLYIGAAAETIGRGRNGSHLPPPAQIRTCGITAYDSSSRKTQAMSASNPHVRTVEVAGASHSVHDDQGEVFNALVAAFLESLA